MLNKFALILYYFIAYNLPAGRFWRGFNFIRGLFVRLAFSGVNIKDGFIDSRVYLSDGRNLTVGAGCEINENVFIQGGVIGDNVLIAPGVVILNSSHAFENISIPIKFQPHILNVNPEICDNVWLGRNVIVLPGVRINQGAVIGAGAVVTKDVPANSVACGVPARVIRYR